MFACIRERKKRCSETSGCKHDKGVNTRQPYKPEGTFMQELIEADNNQATCLTQMTME